MFRVLGKRRAKGLKDPQDCVCTQALAELQAFRSSASTEEQTWWGSVLGGEASRVEVLSLGCTWNQVVLLQGESP